MPPKAEPQRRRDRKDSIQEDLIKAINEVTLLTPASVSDAKVLPLLQEAFREGVDKNLTVTFHHGWPLLCIFGFAGMLRCFEECLLVGSDPTIRTKTDNNVLDCAIDGSRNSPAMVSRMVMLLLNHPKVDSLDATTSVKLAATKNLKEVTERILEKWPRLANTLLMYCVMMGSTQFVELALKKGATVNIWAGVRGCSCLHLAAQSGSVEICKVLLDHGANIEITNGSGDTPFFVALRLGHVDCVKLLIDRGCDVNAKNNNSNSGLDARWLAVFQNQPEILKILKARNDWDRGVKISEVVCAINSNSLECFKILLYGEDFHHCLFLIPQLVEKNRYEMLSFLLLECGHMKWLTVEYLQDHIKQTTNEDIIKLLKTKIELMTTKVKVEVKEEYIEDEEDESQTKKAASKPKKAPAKKKK